MSTFASKRKWQVGAPYFHFFLFFEGFFHEKMECYSTAMIVYRRNIQRVFNKALGVVFKTKTPEMNLAKGDE